MTADPYRYFRVEARELLEELGKGGLALEQGVPSAELVQKLLRVAHTLKGAARVVKQNKIAELAHALEDQLAPLREQQVALTSERVNKFLEVVDSIRDLVSALSEPVSQPQIGALSAQTATPVPAVDEISRTVRVDVAEMDALLGSLTEAAIEIVSLGGATALVEKSRNLADLLAERSFAPRLAAVNGASASAVPPQVQPWAEELRMTTGAAARKLSEGIERIGQRLRDARHRADQLRLVPVRTLQVILERVARDAAQQTGKRVRLEMHGADVRLDADVLSTVQAALVQIVRNCVAHGIEPEPVRNRANKPPVGCITLTVRQDGGRVSFQCRDDGNGIDLESVRRKVQRRGAMPEKVRGLAVRELLDLLLHGGVSTSESVTEVSGRGVGLDLVRDAASRLGGTVHIDTVAGQGTVIELTVPVTLAAIESLLFSVDGFAAAIALHSVRACVRVESSELVRSGNSCHLTHEGNAIPFAFLSDLLDQVADTERAAGCSAVIFEAAGGRAAIGMDRLLGTETIVCRPYPALAPADDLWSGTFLDAGGQPCVVLDPDRAYEFIVKGIVSSEEDDSAVRLPILVIDDSLTTRMLEQSILESAGYKVDIAVSGEEALLKARKQDYSLFLVDVEMPGMDGFTFVSTIRADPVLRKIPAIIVSSLASAEDLRRGKEAGANDYVVKSEFEQKALLKRIRELVD